jgi:hypothetical protein
MNFSNKESYEVYACVKILKNFSYDGIIKELLVILKQFLSKAIMATSIGQVQCRVSCGAINSGEVNSLIHAEPIIWLQNPTFI